MADVKWKILTIFLILCTREFLESLITNLKLDFENSKWRIQYGGRQMKNFNNFPDIVYSRIFGVADYESEIRFWKFKMADPIWRTSNKIFQQFFGYSVLENFYGRWLRI